MTGLNRAFDALLMALAIFAGAIFASIALAVPIDALCRSFLAVSLFGITDLVEYGLMTAVLLAAPWALRRGAHVAVDVLGDLARGRTARGLHVLVCAIGIAVSLIILWFGIEALTSAYTTGRMVRKVLVFPQFWTFIPLNVCFALTTCEFLRQLVSGRSEQRTT